MNIKDIIQLWFTKWGKNDILNLPISDTFSHTSPFGTINGKAEYLKIIEANKDKFLGYTFEIHDAIYETNRACVRYVARQDEEFRLDITEWYYCNDDLIEKIVSYYHIGEIREDRKIENYE